MTELQKTEFDILCCLDAVCRRLELPYFLVCGSALGAVKYGGFIPWDDDIDVAMYREDYERFLKEAPALLPEHLFLQNYRTDPAFPQVGSKLRNSNTAYIEKTVAHLPMHHGIYIDVFPLDGYPAGSTQRKLFEVKKRIYEGVLHSGCEYPRTAFGSVITKLCRMTGLSRRTHLAAARYDRLIRKYPVRPGGVVCNHANAQGAQDYSPWEHFGKGAQACFEGLAVRIPAEYHSYLIQKYGDYAKDPEPDQRRGHHDYTVCDCAGSYRQYSSPKRGL